VSVRSIVPLKLGNVQLDVSMSIVFVVVNM
jgi:hypothetical protein